MRVLSCFSSCTSVRAFLFIVLASVPDGIAVDKIQKSIFFTDTGTDQIATIDYNGGSNSVILSIMDEPRAITLDFANK